MKENALKLIKEIQKSNSNIVDTNKYLDLILNTQSRLSEFMYNNNDFNKSYSAEIKADKELQVSTLRQLLSIARQGVLIKDNDFININVDFDNLIIK